MPFEKKAETFNSLLERALKNKEIVEWMKGAEVTPDFLAANVKKREKEIWDAGVKEIEEVNDLEKTLELKRLEMKDLTESLRLKQKELSQTEPSALYPTAYSSMGWGRSYDSIGWGQSYDVSSFFPPLSRWQRLLPNITLLFVAVIALLAIGYIVSSFFVGWTTVFKWLVAHYGLIMTCVAIATVVAIPICFYLLDQIINVRRKEMAQRNEERYKTAKVEYGRAVKECEQLERDLGIDVLERRITEAKKAVEQAILDNGILPELRLVINDYLSSSYDTSLRVLSAPGLAEVFNPTYEIPTKSKSKLLRLLKNMPGGSIGVAGPRGSGKTTLLQSLCISSAMKIQGRPVLSIMTPAPVEYDARDFTLHLFSALCLRLLKLKRSGY